MKKLDNWFLTVGALTALDLAAVVISHQTLSSDYQLLKECFNMALIGLGSLLIVLGTLKSIR